MATSVRQISVDWQTTKETVRDRTAFLFNNSLMSDIKFVVTDSQHESDGRQVRVPAHKLVLTISSPVFEAMFYGDLAEKGEEIKLPDTESNYLLEFLRFLYCDEVRLTPDNAFGVLYLAQKYIVPTLAAKCRLFVLENTDETNAFQILEEAKIFQESKLEKGCWDIIEDDTSACLDSDRLLTSSHDTLVSLLKRDTLSVEEFHLFEAVKRWAEAKCQDKGLEKTGSALREILGDAVDLIRFPAMLEEDFARYVVPTRILTSDEALEVHQFFSGFTTAENLRFSCSDRLKMFTQMSPLLRCSRYASGDTFGCPGKYAITEEFTFKTDKHIHLRGVRLYVGDNNKPVHANVLVMEDEGRRHLAAAEGTFNGRYTFSGSSKYSFGFDVVFDSPVRVRATSKYVCRANVTHMDGKNVWYNYMAASRIASCDGVNFTFEENSNESCQTLEMLFHK